MYGSATRPDHTTCYALPADMASALPPEILAEAEIDRRRLCKTELAEIERHVAAARRPSWALIAFSLWTALGVAAAYAWPAATSFPEHAEGSTSLPWMPEGAAGSDSPSLLFEHPQRPILPRHVKSRANPGYPPRVRDV